MAALFPIKLPLKLTKCCLRQSIFLKKFILEEDTPTTPLWAPACGARWLVPRVRTHISSCEILATGLCVKVYVETCIVKLSDEVCASRTKCVGENKSRWGVVLWINFKVLQTKARLVLYTSFKNNPVLV